MPKIDEKIAGVYVIRFDDGNLYVGKSDNLKKRFSQWVKYMTERKHITPRMINSLINSSEIVFEIIELVEDISTLRQREAMHIWKTRDQCTLVGTELINTINPFNLPTKEFVEYEKQKTKDFSHVWGDTLFGR